MEQLKKLSIWICWNRKEVKGRMTKVPCAASGGATGTTKEYAHTWGTFDEAVAAMKKRGYTGIGFVIPEGVFFIDKDHIDPKDPIIQRLLELFPSYAECSFSAKACMFSACAI